MVLPATRTNTMAILRMITMTMHMNTPAISTITAPTTNRCC